MAGPRPRRFSQLFRCFLNIPPPVLFYLSPKEKEPPHRGDSLLGISKACELCP